MILFKWKFCSLRINCVAKLILLFGFVLKSSPEHEHILIWICILNFLSLYSLVRNEIYALQREKYTAAWYVILQSSATAAILNLQYKANYRVQWIRDHYGSNRNCFNIVMVLFVLNRWNIKIWNWKTAVVSRHKILFHGIPTLWLLEIFFFSAIAADGSWFYP